MPRPRMFVVGDVSQGADYSQDYIDKLVYRLALWFQDPECDRTYDDPVGAARQKLKECLLGITEDGSEWRSAPHEFAARVKAKCAFDIEKDAGIPSRRVKSPLAIAKQKEREAEAGAANVGRDLADVFGFDAEAFRTDLQADLLKTFPELDNPAHLPNVRSLVMYYVEREKIDRQLGLGVSDAKRLTLLDSLRKIEEMADTTMKRLGIHPDQVRKKIADKGASSIADLVALVSDDADFKQRERIWALQAALQLWWMSEHTNGSGNGPQLSDFEIWHLTRTRPVKFTCRHGETYTVVEGFEPTDLRNFLVREGVLVEEPVLPGITPAAALQGLATADLTTVGTLHGQEATHAGHGAGGAVVEGAPDDPAGEPGQGA